MSLDYSSSNCSASDYSSSDHFSASRALAPLQDSPRRLTHIETAALNRTREENNAKLAEKYALLVDAALAECFRLDPLFVTRLRQVDAPSYERLRGRWLTEGDALLARRHAQVARISLGRHRRLRETETLREQGSAFRFALPQRCASAETASLESSPSDECLDAGEDAAESSSFESLSVAERFGKGLLDFFRQDVLVFGLLLAACYFAFGVLYPGGWTGAWADWMGASR